MAIGG
jgi:hypothetical protein